MDTANNDKETSEMMINLKNVRDFVNSEGFKYVKVKMAEKIEQLMNLAEISDELLANPEKFALEVKARKLAASVIAEWWATDVVGASNQYDHINSKSTGKSHIVMVD